MIMIDTHTKGANMKKLDNEEIRRVTLTIRLPRWIISFLNNNPREVGKVIEQSLITTHKLTPPQGVANETKSNRVRPSLHR
jgi:hypothetical protein